MTFLDSEIPALLGEQLDALLFTCVGVPEYTSAAGGPPGAPTAIRKVAERALRQPDAGAARRGLGWTVTEWSRHVGVVDRVLSGRRPACAGRRPFCDSRSLFTAKRKKE